MKTYEYIGVDKCSKYKYYNIIDYYTCAECSDFYEIMKWNYDLNA